jgi:hypothetical protein
LCEGVATKKRGRERYFKLVDLPCVIANICLKTEREAVSRKAACDAAFGCLALAFDFVFEDFYCI